jgi:hypothetical protein
MARVGTDVNLWKMLEESETPLSLAQIAEKTSADRVLLSTLKRTCDFLTTDMRASRACIALLRVISHARSI